MDKIERLEKALSEIEKLGFSGQKIVDYLTKINGLEEMKNHVERLVANSIVQLNSKGKELQDVSETVTAEGAELEKLNEAVTHTGETVTKLQQQAKEFSDSIELSKIFFQLLHEPGTLVDQQILMTEEMLRQILKARGDVRGLPVDYRGLRERFHGLVETVLQDKLLPRDRLDREMSKLRAQWAEIRACEEQLLEERVMIDNAAWDRILEVAVGQIRKGTLFLGGCSDCKTMAAVRRGSKSQYYSYYKCPMCTHSLDQRDLPEIKQIPA